MLDARRVFAVGISNGGMMAQRLACDLTARLTGVASIIAAMPAPIEASPWGWYLPMTSPTMRADLR